MQERLLTFPKTIVVVLKDFLVQHSDDVQKLLRGKLYFPAFMSLMTAIEIYLKIHLTIFCFIHTSILSSTRRKQIEILTGDKKLLNNFQYSVKSRYSHNLIAMIEDLSILIEEMPDELKALKSSIASLSGKDWVNKRYDTDSVANECIKINRSFDSFQKFIKWMQENSLEGPDKVRNK